MSDKFYAESKTSEEPDDDSGFGNTPFGGDLPDVSISAGWYNGSQEEALELLEKHYLIVRNAIVRSGE